MAPSASCHKINAPAASRTKKQVQKPDLAPSYSTRPVHGMGWDGTDMREGTGFVKRQGSATRHNDDIPDSAGDACGSQTCLADDSARPGVQWLARRGNHKDGVWMKWESGCQPARWEAALQDGKSLGEIDAVVLGEGDVGTAQLRQLRRLGQGPAAGKAAGGSSTRSCTARPGN